MQQVLFYGLLLAVLIPCTKTFVKQLFLFMFLSVNYKLNTLNDPVEFPPASRSQYIKNFAKEFFYALGKYYNIPLKYISLTIRGQDNSDTAILLIHGYTRNEGDWLWLRRQFAVNNAWVFAVQLHPKLAGIDEIAQRSLSPKINEIKKETGCKHIVLIGASMGGLVASYYKEFLDNQKYVKAVITIGSALRGTQVAVAAPGLNSQQMCLGSQFLAELRERMLKNPEYYYQVASKFDEVIFPWDSALFSETPSSQKLIMPFSGHLSMLHDPDIAAQLSDWVQKIQTRSIQ